MSPLANLRDFGLLDQERHPHFQTMSRTCAGAAWRPHRGRSLEGHQTGTLTTSCRTTASSSRSSSLSSTQRSPSR